MKRTTVRAALAMLSLLMLLPSALAGAQLSPVSTPGIYTLASQPGGGFADEAFRRVWTRTDEPVANGSVMRSFYWGPAPIVSMMEDYAEGLGGKRLVQYFDKSRMEINNPAFDKTTPFYVTNGLLTIELISGRMQVGNNSFATRYSAEINVASDTDDVGRGTPTYASFKHAINTFASPGNSNLGQTVVSTINRTGDTGSDARYGRYDVKYLYHEPATRRSIPDVFWRFLNTVGPVVVDGKVVNARLSDPYFYATGYPIADAYWASVKIAGVANTDVLIQPYERRVLTYVPSAPEGFQVQMGNIGRHYYDWRYGGAGKPLPTMTPPILNCRTTPTTPIRGFGKVWADHPETQRALGCPRTTERAATVIQQPFERGQMVEVKDYYQYGPYGGGTTTIHVLFADGTMQHFADTYVEGEAEPAITSPPGLYVPKRGLGKVWREGTGARVRERLGWATAPETMAAIPAPPIPRPQPTSTPRPDATPTTGPIPGTGGAVQDFEKGKMIYAGPVLRKIYVLYDDDSYPPINTNRWAVYDDLFGGP